MSGSLEGCGFIYICHGERFLAEALASIRSLRRHMAGVPVTVFADVQVGTAPLPGVEVVAIELDRTVRPERHVGFLAKALNMGRSPYARTVFLDTDTHVCADLAELFRLLDRVDLAAAHAPVMSSWDVVPEEGAPPLSDAFPEFNTGVVAWRRNDRTARFFAEWTAGYRRLLAADPGLPHDQPAFRLAAWRDGELRLATLPPNYNLVVKAAGSARLRGPVRILHGRRADLDAIAAAVNADLDRRLVACFPDLPVVVIRPDDRVAVTSCRPLFEE